MYSLAATKQAMQETWNNVDDEIFVKAKLASILSDLKHMQESLSEELSELVALSEDRLTLLESLHVKIDKEADTALRKLTDAMTSVSESRKRCHEKLEVMLGGQIHEIQAHVKTLETRMRLVTEYDETQRQTQTLKQAEVHSGVKLTREVQTLLERAGDVEARAVIDHQQQAIVSTKQELIKYSVPVLWRDTSYHPALIDAMSVTNKTAYGTDMEIICVNENCEQYSTFVSHGNTSSGTVHVFNTITGELQRTIGDGLGQVFGLALLRTPMPLLFVSCYNQHKISVFSAMSGELVKTIGTYGVGQDQLNHPWGLCVRPSNQAARLYVCDNYNHRVQVFDSDSGRSVMTIGTGVAGASDSQFKRPFGVTTFDGNRIIEQPRLFIADYGNHRIQSFDANTGTFIRTYGPGVMGTAAGTQLSHWSGSVRSGQCQRSIIDSL